MGKTQFTERWTVNLTPEQSETTYRLLEVFYPGMSKQDFLALVLETTCEKWGIRWPRAEKLPPGRKNAPRVKGKFTKA